jgi:hypothetical protein
MDEVTAADGAAYVGTLRRDPCAYCGAPGGTLDRIVPGSHGGSYCWMNTTGACRSCNSSKGSRTPLGHLLRVLADPGFDARCRAAIATGSPFRIIYEHEKVAEEARALAGVGR